MKTLEQDKLNEIRNTLRGFSGTEQYRKLGIAPGVVGTDGVAYLCEQCQCYWLFDVIASYQHKLRNEGFQVWKLELTPGNPEQQAIVTAQDDEPGRRLATQAIPCTDFPLPEGIKLWVETTSVNGKHLAVVLLPGEH